MWARVTVLAGLAALVAAGALYYANRRVGIAEQASAVESRAQMERYQHSERDQVAYAGAPRKGEAVESRQRANAEAESRRAAIEPRAVTENRQSSEQRTERPEFFFPWPPPRASSVTTFASLNSKTFKTIGDVADFIELAVRKGGIDQVSYF